MTEGTSAIDGKSQGCSVTEGWSVTRRPRPEIRRAQPAAATESAGLSQCPGTKQMKSQTQTPSKQPRMPRCDQMDLINSQFRVFGLSCLWQEKDGERRTNPYTSRLTHPFKIYSSCLCRVFILVNHPMPHFSPDSGPEAPVATRRNPAFQAGTRWVPTGYTPRGGFGLKWGRRAPFEGRIWGAGLQKWGAVWAPTDGFRRVPRLRGAPGSKSGAQSGAPTKGASGPKMGRQASKRGGQEVGVIG